MKERGIEKEYLSATKFFIAINTPKMQVLFLLSPSSIQNHKSYPFPQLNWQSLYMISNKQ